MEIDPLTGDEMARMLVDAHATPKSIVQQAAALVEPVQ